MRHNVIYSVPVLENVAYYYIQYLCIRKCGTVVYTVCLY
jgi:hypothetical protein